MAATRPDWEVVASESFSAVSSLVGTEYRRTALSRAYYASYAKVVAALLDNGVTMPARGNPSHQSLPGLILTHLTRLSQGRRNSLSAVVMTLYRLRIVADYQPALVVGADDVRIGTGLMRQVFRDAKEAMS